MGKAFQNDRPCWLTSHHNHVLWNRRQLDGLHTEGNTDRHSQHWALKQQTSARRETVGCSSYWQGQEVSKSYFSSYMLHWPERLCVRDSGNSGSLYKSVVKGTPAGWPAQQGLLPANGSVYPPNCFLNKPPLEAEADGQSLRTEWKMREKFALHIVCTVTLESTTRTLLFHHLLKSNTKLL